MALYNYEVTDEHGNTTTLQLTEEDAQRFPNAKQVGPAHNVQEPDEDDEGDGDAGNTASAPVSTRTAGAERVPNRARRQQ